MDFTKQQNRAARKFRMTNEKTGEELLFESRGKAVAFLEVDKTTFFSYLEKNIPLKTGELRKFKNIVRLERNLQVFFFNCGKALRASYTTSIAKAGVECSKSKKIG